MTKAEVINMMAREGFWNPSRMSAVQGTANDIMKRIDRHFRRMKIHPYKNVRNNASRKHPYTGNLLRSIHWEVYNATEGDDILLRFYMSVVAKFVETGSQLGTHTFNKDQITPVEEMEYRGIPRANDAGVMQHRRAKPFISGELRVHGRMLMDRLVNYYGREGYMFMVSPFFDRALGEAAGTDIENQAIFEITHGGWQKVMDDVRYMDLTKE